MYNFIAVLYTRYYKKVKLKERQERMGNLKALTFLKDKIIGQS
jgi:hypothetical protein